MSISEKVNSEISETVADHKAPENLMIRSKCKNQPINPTKVTVDMALNVRLANNYDINSIEEKIVALGRIIKPVIIDGDTMKVLAGNRRILAAQRLLARTDLDPELRKELEKTPAQVYHGLSQQEINTLIYDHGDEKRLSKTEIVMAIWRLDEQWYTEAQIVMLMYSALADYTGNARKLKEVPTEPKAKAAYLKKWFHGTLGNVILKANKMGDFVREQFLLTRKKEDGLMLKDEVLEMEVSNDRLKQLSAAQTLDEAEDGWDAVNLGKHFKAKIADFIAEDKGEKKDEGFKRPSAKDLKDKAATMKTLGMRQALLLASGDESAGRDLKKMDAILYRLELVTETIFKKLPLVVDTEVATLLRAIIGDGPAGEVDVALEVFTKSALPTVEDETPPAPMHQPSDAVTA